MPLQKILFKPGVNRENTRYTTEGGWYECDKIRFRQGNPEVIGGWEPFSASTYQGVCRSLWNWSLLDGTNVIGVGTNLKFYIEQGSLYYDVTPLRVVPAPTINNNPFVATNGSAVITVTDTNHGCVTGDFVTFSGATGLGGNITATVLNAEYQVTVLTPNTYTFVASATANATDVSGSPGGGASVVAAYQVNVGPAIPVPLTGWGAGAWGQTGTTWGNSGTSTSALRLWNQINFGQNLIYGPRSGPMYYWDATNGVSTRGVALTSLGDAETPVVQNSFIVSDASRFLIVFGTNDPNSASPTALDPMFIRWSDQEDPFTWIPSATNQAGSLRLSHGSEIVTYVQTRQEIVVFTDSSVYSLQYLGPPYVWGSQLLGDNISVMSPNSVVIASGVVYWMGVDKFYAYDGRVQTLNCDLRRYVFGDLNQDQSLQVFCGTDEGFNEVWWFYCSANSTTINKYVIYNYAEKVWYYGTMERTAWLDSGLQSYPIAAKYNSTELTGNLINQETGLNDNTDGTPLPISAYIASSEFDIGDGHNFGFVWRVLPDLTFENSEDAPNGDKATVTMELYGLANSGSGVTSDASQPVRASSSYNITEEFTGMVFTRMRGRQMIFKIKSEQLNTTWQLGAPRIDIRPDGRR